MLAAMSPLPWTASAACPGCPGFPATPAGYARLPGWLQSFGTVCLVGVEGTGSYGAGLARHICAAGIGVVEAGRPGRQGRRRTGKSDPTDAVSAARAALSGRAPGAPRGRDGQVEAIRALMVAKRTARAQRTQTTCQARALIVTGPDDIRTRFTGQAPVELVAGLAALRPRPGSMVGYHPGRLRSEAAWAHLCAAAPIPASSGKVARHRHGRGGDRQASHALWRIVLTRMGSHPPTRAYVARRSNEGLSKPEIIRCLKRYAARETYRHLRPR